MEADCVLCAVRTEPLYLMYNESSLQWLKELVFGAYEVLLTAHSTANAICVKPYLFR